MLNKIFKKEKPRVYLGTIAVAPRTDMKRYFDEWDIFKKEDLDSSLRKNLEEIFSLPLKEAILESKNSDLAIDVIIPKFQSGDSVNLSVGDLGFPLMWRPKITVSSRLYYLESEKTKSTFSVTEKLGFRQYIGRLFSLRGIFRFRPLFDAKDMEYLLYKACHKLLLKMQKAI